MKIRLVHLMLYFLLISLIPQPSQACTVFRLDQGDQLVVGKNYDWMQNDNLIIINKENVSKTTLANPEMNDYQTANWTSKYGSVTFNQYGRGFPLEGMN